MTAEDIKKHLWRKFVNYEYKLFNVFVFGNESDFLAVSKSGYVWEIEIKVSKSDFKNDFDKIDLWGKNKHKQLQSGHTFKPHKFCFAVPEGMITKDEIPDYAGLIYVSHYAEIVKQPKFLHKENLFENNYFLKKLLSKFYYKHMKLMNELDYRQWEVQYEQERIQFL